LSDNISLLRLAGQGASSDVQSLTFQSQARTSLSNVGAQNIDFTDTDLDGKPAEQVNYSISSSGTDVFGEQFYVVSGEDVFILTVTTGTADRTSSAADEISNSWTFD
jgi:hypothetical protein